MNEEDFVLVLTKYYIFYTLTGMEVRVTALSIAEARKMLDDFGFDLSKLTVGYGVG